jgi:hypothetical protein
MCSGVRRGSDLLTRRSVVLSRRSAASPRHRHRCADLILLAFLAVLTSTAAAAAGNGNGNGRWWWDADVRFRQRVNESTRDGQDVNTFSQQEVGARFGLHGFIVHPSLADFVVDTDFALNKFDRGGDLDSNLLGLGAQINLIPRGAYPARLYFRRRGYDYTASGEFDTLTRVSWPDVGTEWGGGLRIRRGAFRGTVFGLDHRTTDFVDPRLRREQHRRHFVDWSRSSARFNHHFRLRHRDWKLGTSDLSFRNYTFNLDERGRIAPRWDWESHLSGLRQDTAGSTLDTTTEEYRLRNRFLHTRPNGDLLDLSYNLQSLLPVSGKPILGNALSVVYRWRPLPGVQVGPFARYTVNESDDLKLRAPSGGVVASWRRQRRLLDTGLTGRVGYGLVQRENGTQATDQTEWIYAFTGSIGHGRPEGLRKDFEVQYNQNDLTMIRRQVGLGGDLPPLGFPRLSFDGETFRARLGFRHRWDSSQWHTWGQWTLRQSTDVQTLEELESETYSINGRFAARRWDVNVEGSGTDLVVAGRTDQTLRFISGSANWRPISYLYFGTLFRSDRREVPLAADVEGQRIEVRGTVLLGRLRLEASAFQISEQVIGGAERTNLNLRFMVAMRFSGGLPIVTGTKRRGVIR